jgi:transcriptional regulator with XRE-family HTH domain
LCLYSCLRYKEHRQNTTRIGPELLNVPKDFLFYRFSSDVGTIGYTMKKKPKNQLGQRLENLRLALRLRQKEMALECGLNPSYLSDLINGKKDNPGIETILKIAKRFNVNLNYLLLSEGEMFLPDKAEELQKEQELNLDIDTIDDLYRIMRRSKFVSNSLIGYAVKLCIENEETIKKEIERRIEKEEMKKSK